MLPAYNSSGFIYIFKSGSAIHLFIHRYVMPVDIESLEVFTIHFTRVYSISLQAYGLHVGYT